MRNASSTVVSFLAGAALAAAAFSLLDRSATPGAPASGAAVPLTPAVDPERERLEAELERRDAERAVTLQELAALQRQNADLGAELERARLAQRASDALAAAAAPAPEAPKSTVEWLRRALPDRFADLTAEEAAQLDTLSLRGVPVTDADLAFLAGLPNLQSLDLRGADVTDAGLWQLAALSRLRALELRGTKVEGTALHALPPTIEHLDLTDTRLTELALPNLHRLPLLNNLDLNRAAIGDAAIETLGALPGLRKIELDGTAITDAGLRRLVELNPALERIEARATATEVATAVELRRTRPGLTIVQEPAGGRYGH